MYSNILTNGVIPMPLSMKKIGPEYAFSTTNVRLSTDLLAGCIRAYTVFDLSATYSSNRYALKAGINNISDKAYFTRCTDEYRGPESYLKMGEAFI